MTQVVRGVHPPIFKKFSDWKIFKILPFPEKFLLVIDHKFRISPLFSSVSVHSPLFCENYYFSPTLKNSPCFRKIPLLFTYFMCISFPPYFDHAYARTGHPCEL